MKERYENFDGLRAFSAIGIILMHIAANAKYNLQEIRFLRSIIAEFTNLVFLFMLLSAFSLCCGYYNKFKEGQINLNQFYLRRFERIWPCFALLCTLDLLMNHNLESLYEWIADLTLMFGLLPNARISVIGVGWFLGVIFVLYLLFPFFVFAIDNKRRAWFSFGVSIVLCFLCSVYFFDNDHVLDGFSARSNILYCSMYFVAGGLIYIYRAELKNLVEKYPALWLAMLIVATICYFSVFSTVFMLLVVFVLLTIILLPEDRFKKIVFQNKVIRYMGSISMEMYLCHMLVYRVCEKAGLLHVTGVGIIDYFIMIVLVISGAMVVAAMINKMVQYVILKMKSYR